ncbi:MAG: hypothetical protein QOE45_2696 [Frankiaceae bacterium]|nr:hypothetical protein [Frankiaceae bacterium]
MAGSRRLGGLAAGLVLAGGLVSHALDEEGLLPGVRESARIREYADRGAPRLLLLLGCVAVSALTGYVAARVDRRRRGIAPVTLVVLVVAGQAVQFAAFEVLARLAAGLDVAEVFVEPAFATGVLVQTLIGAAFVLLLLTTGRRLLALAAPPGLPAQPDRPPYITRPAARARTRRPESLPWGRAPPAGAAPRPAR